ncbi:MAG: inositol monophosphatase family protein [bacterium]
MLNVAISAAMEAGNIQKDNLVKKRIIQYKDQGKKNLVTDVDTLCERRIIEIIRSKFPDHSFLAEEGNNSQSDSAYKWIIDPLDGTTNYAHGYPFFLLFYSLREEWRVNYRGRLRSYA